MKKLIPLTYQYCNSPRTPLADIVRFATWTKPPSAAHGFQNASDRERYPHPYKECFVPLSSRCGISQIYYPSLQEVESVVKQKGCYSIQMMENLPQEMPQPKVMSITLRAGLEETTKEHFGDVNVDELFDLLVCILEEASSITESCESDSLFILFKRIPN
ncbi:SAM dependent carboxyl methyltransferase [Parasponia andersonii]|uniref:SAM dependent carboxyl methyltransferase n=1 Tax=Parasponia andersonii TaxID=3476 RepID=A0A2P5B7I8_PARAD|nr:SAM dependent carboxyl methyltransferase [Parasponia andersonii]